MVCIDSGWVWGCAGGFAVFAALCLLLGAIAVAQARQRRRAAGPPPGGDHAL